jgi:hypothetical protein
MIGTPHSRLLLYIHDNQYCDMILEFLLLIIKFCKINIESLEGIYMRTTSLCSEDICTVIPRSIRAIIEKYLSY